MPTSVHVNGKDPACVSLKCVWMALPSLAELMAYSKCAISVGGVWHVQISMLNNVRQTFVPSVNNPLFCHT